MIIVGGDDSNTNAALITEYFKDKNSDVIFVVFLKLLMVILKMNILKLHLLLILLIKLMLN